MVKEIQCLMPNGKTEYLKEWMLRAYIRDRLKNRELLKIARTALVIYDLVNDEIVIDRRNRKIK